MPLSSTCTVWDFIRPHPLLFTDTDLALLFFISPTHISRIYWNRVILSGLFLKYWYLPIYNTDLFYSISLLCLKTIVYFYPMPKPHFSTDKSELQRVGSWFFKLSRWFSDTELRTTDLIQQHEEWQGRGGGPGGVRRGNGGGKRSWLQVQDAYTFPKSRY